MAQQVEEDGWPLGLQPLNLRSVSISSFFTGSPSSFSVSSSDLDTESVSDPELIIQLSTTDNKLKISTVMQSTGSFFHGKSVTLGNLMGVSSILEFSRRSRRNSKILSEPLGTRTKPNHTSKAWCLGFCLCQKDHGDVINNSRNNNIVPLGHFLEVERRAAQDHSRGQHSPFIYGADEFTLAQPFQESSNSLFVDGQIIPPTVSSSPVSNSYTNKKRASRGFITPCF